MTIRDHYVVVAVTPGEIQFEQESLVQRLADVPIAGVLVSAILRSSSEDERQTLLDALDDRLSRVEAGLRELEGCSARVVDVHESVRLLATFWESEATEYGDMNRVIRTRPLVGGRS
jgi:hypothetical protein